VTTVHDVALFRNVIIPENPLNSLRQSGRRSRLDDVWVLEQYEPHALNDHLANGRPWDLDRTHGGLRILPPSSVATVRRRWPRATPTRS